MFHSSRKRENTRQENPRGLSLPYSYPGSSPFRRWIGSLLFGSSTFKIIRLTTGFPCGEPVDTDEFPQDKTRLKKGHAFPTAAGD